MKGQQCRNSGWEFFVYCWIHFSFVLYMFYEAYNTSNALIQQSHNSRNPHQRLKNTLRQGWFSSRLIDLTDDQYRTFRDYLPNLMLIIVAWISISRVLIYLLKNWNQLQITKHFFHNTRMLTIHVALKTKILLSYYLFASIFLQISIYGIRVVFMYILMFFNYLIVKISFKIEIQTKYKIILFWMYNLIIGYFVLQYNSNSKYFSFTYWLQLDGSSNTNIMINNNYFPFFSFFDFFTSKQLSTLDRWSLFGSIKQGPILRWDQSFRYILLKIISFNMDLIYYYKNKRNLYHSHYQNQNKIDMTVIRNERDCSLLSYFAYTLYFPLHFAGPIISFHEWMSQVKINLFAKVNINKNYYTSTKNQRKETRLRWIIQYSARLIIYWILYEFLLHFFYTNYISRFKFKPVNSLTSDTSMIINLFCVSYVHLHLIYVKFLVLWRFLRLWVIIGDNIVCIENMPRCISNTISLSQFWQYWHASFNVWNKRYIFIPLGGNFRSSKYNTKRITTTKSFQDDTTRIKSKQNGNNIGTVNYHKICNFIKYLSNICVVFAFTALWHGDFEPRLFFWGIIMGLSIVVEIVVSHCYWTYVASGGDGDEHRGINKLFNNTKAKGNKRCTKYITAFGGTVQILLLIIGNTVGFGSGVETLYLLINVFTSDCKTAVIAATCAVICFMPLVLILKHLRGNSDHHTSTVL